MVILNKFQGEDELTEASDPADAPPSYEAITAASSDNRPTQIVDEKSPRPPATSNSSLAGTPRSSNPTSWLSRLTFTSRPSKQVRQTVHVLVRDLVFNAESPNLLCSCAEACRTYGLDLPALLQEQTIEQHSAIYWAILNRRDALIPSLLEYAAPLSQSTVSELRLACLATANQALFQSLRNQHESFMKYVAPLSTGTGADALVLGSIPADEVSIREIEGQGAFVAEMQINLWQKRMRVSGRVSVEFIARGRIWSLTFFSPPSTTMGMWQVALSLLEHSPPTFIDSRLIIDLPPPPSNSPTSLASGSQRSDLISLSPPLDVPNSPLSRSPPPPPSPPLLNKSKSKSKVPQSIEVRLKSTHRLAHRASGIIDTIDAAFSGQKGWSPSVDSWTDSKGIVYTSAIIVPLDDGAGAELSYDNTPFIAPDGTLYAHFEARLGKPETECIIC